MLDRASERLSLLETQTQALRDCGQAAWHQHLAGDAADRPSLTLGAIHLMEDESMVTWFFRRDRLGQRASIWVGADGHFRWIGEGPGIGALRVVADWVLGLPARVQHPVLGALTHTVTTAQYVAFRPAEEPALIRVDLAPADAAGLASHLDACALLLSHIQSGFEDSKRRAESMLGTWWRSRCLPPFRWEIEWAVFLEERTAALFARDMLQPDEAGHERFLNLSLYFDAAGAMAEAAVTTERETHRVRVPAPSAPQERVAHTKFGEGSVVAQLDGKKVRVRFDDGLERVLLRDFLMPTSRP